MESFKFVIFGFTSNLAQLKIIPALYDLEAKNLIADGTEIIGIGRKDIDPKAFIEEVLHTPNRHHQHDIDPGVLARLQERCTYIREDFNKEENTLYSNLKNHKGNMLYYLATYPDLYEGIFENLNKHGLNKPNGNWIKIMIEKPIGNNLESSKKLNDLLSKYFNEKDIFRVDHYLGKEDLQKVFNEEISNIDVDHIQLSVTEDFGVGKRGVYYDATGALVDMGQNHFMQMLAAVAKKDKSVASREEVIGSLIPDQQDIVFGQYEGYTEEENVEKGSTADTFFALKTKLSAGPFKDIPIYMRSGKFMTRSEVKISIVYKNSQIKSWIIESTGVGKNYDPYEKLILEAVNGNQFYFNSAREVELSWKFIDELSVLNVHPFVYKKGTNGPEKANELITRDGRNWI